MTKTIHSIEFDELMECVKYMGEPHGGVTKPYRLELYGQTYFFKDTEEIVPFVEKKLGYKVII